MGGTLPLSVSCRRAFHHASCLCTKNDGNDLIRPVKPDREKDISRIDLLAATIDALARAVVVEDKSVSYTELRSVDW